MKNVPSGSSAKRKSPYVFFKQCTFLSKCAGGITTEGTSTQETASTNLGPYSSDVLPPKRNKGAKSASRDEELLNALTSSLKRREERESLAEGDEDRLFLLSLLPEMKKIRDHDKLSAKMDILRVIQQRQNQPFPLSSNITAYRAPSFGQCYQQGTNAPPILHNLSPSTPQRYAEPTSYPADVLHPSLAFNVGLPAPVTTEYTARPNEALPTLTHHLLNTSDNTNERSVSVDSSASSATLSPCESQIADLFQ